MPVFILDFYAVLMTFIEITVENCPTSSLPIRFEGRAERGGLVKCAWEA